MEQLTRRGFIGGTAAAAAGVALGVWAEKGVQRHGPVELRTYFLSNEPIVIPCDLWADEKRDIFGIHAFVEPGVDPIVQISLSAMKRAIEAGSARSKVILLVTDGQRRRTSRVPLAMTVENRKVTFLIEEGEGHVTPVWLDLPDVRRVL